MCVRLKIKGKGRGKTLVGNARLNMSCFTRGLVKPFKIIFLDVSVLGRKKNALFKLTLVNALFLG